MSVHLCPCFTQLESSVAAATVSSSLGQRLPFPAYPMRNSLPPLAPVKASGPPAEYHSDSAESLEEIPVAMARLGSAALAGAAAPIYTSACAASAAYPSSLQCTLPPLVAGQPLPSPQPRTKRKVTTHKASEQRFEMVSHNASVFASREGGEGAVPQEGTKVVAGHKMVKRKRTGKRRSVEDSKLGSRLGTPLA